jgi:hypothetical protein
LSLDPMSGIISGAPTNAGVYDFTIQVSDSLSEVATAAFSITVVGRLQGNYGITFNGFDNGRPFYMVGSFVADGNGNITSGFLDQNGPTGVSTAVALTTGSGYSIPTHSNLGTITLVSALGTYVYNIALSNTSDSKIILSDPNHPQVYGSGLLKKQTAMTFSGSPQNYSFGFFGNDSGGHRLAGAGMFALSSTLAVTGGAEDTNDNGTASGELPITGGSFSLPCNYGSWHSQPERDRRRQ